MRGEINVVMFFADKEVKNIKAFIKLNENFGDEDIIDEMSNFIDSVIKQHRDEFRMGIATLMVGGDELFQLSFSNKRGRSLWNLTIPDETTVH